MRILIFAFAALLTQAVPGPQPATVAGTVVKQGTGEPLSKATVILYASDGGRAVFSATTDANGGYAFGNVPPGQYRISATRTNYVRAEFGDRGSNGCGSPVSLIPGQRFSDARIAMLPAGIISGHLYDADREGIPGLSAHALKYVYENGKAVLTIVQTVQTNDLGEFRLFGLTPGRYYVAAALETPGPSLATQIVLDVDIPLTLATANAPETPAQPLVEEPFKGDRHLPVYFPAALDPLSARAIELRPGETVGGVDVTVTFSRPVRISGRVANSVSQETPRSLRVTLMTRLAHPNAGTPIRTTSVKPDGTFEMADVLPGPYFLVAAGLDSSGRLTGRASVDVGETNLQNVVVEISRGFELEGRVAVDDPKIMERLMEISLMPANPAPGRTQPSSARIDQKNGSFKFQGITPGEYVPFVNFRADGQVDLYVKTLRLGSQDVRDGIRLDAQPGGQLEMVVGNHGAVVEGTVVNDKQIPVAGATVVLVPDIFLRKRASYYKTGRTDASGQFRLQAISPGDYKLYAWEEAETGAWQDPDFLRPYETRGKALTLREGTTQQSQLSVIPSAGPLYGQCPGPFMGVR